MVTGNCLGTGRARPNTQGKSRAGTLICAGAAMMTGPQLLKANPVESDVNTSEMNCQ